MNTTSGQHAPLIIDIAGLTLTKTDRQRLKHPLTGGLILFARNWENRAQLSALCAEIKKVRKDLLICVDHEGGRVQRFKTDGFTHLPPMRALGQMWLKDGQSGEGAGAMAATNAATACGYVLGAELRACGVDFSFTPVLDLDWGESCVIGDRAFSRDPRLVALLAKSLMHGLLQAGMANCGKHFPGHGFVKADSHTDIPVDRRSLKAILADDAAPYDWLNTTLTSVMPAHVIYPKVDTRPAGFSEKWLGYILRGHHQRRNGLLDHHKAGGVVGLVGHAHVGAQLPGFEPGLELAMQYDVRLAAGGFGNFAVPPGHGHAHAHADGFAKSFFGRKTGGQVANAALGPSLAAMLPGCKFSVAQDLECKAFAVARQAGAYAPDITDVGTDAVNHGASKAASMQRRYSLTVAV